jgi:hypothetical protein
MQVQAVVVVRVRVAVEGVWLGGVVWLEVVVGRGHHAVGLKFHFGIISFRLDVELEHVTGAGASFIMGLLLKIIEMGRLM